MEDIRRGRMLLLGSSGAARHGAMPVYRQSWACGPSDQLDLHSKSPAPGTRIQPRVLSTSCCLRQAVAVSLTLHTWASGGRIYISCCSAAVSAGKGSTRKLTRLVYSRRSGHVASCRRRIRFDFVHGFVCAAAAPLFDFLTLAQNKLSTRVPAGDVAEQTYLSLTRTQVGVSGFGDDGAQC